MLQSVQDDAPLEEYVPAAQGLQTPEYEAPISKLYMPAEHSMHAPPLVFGLLVPTPTLPPVQHVVTQSGAALSSTPVDRSAINDLIFPADVHGLPTYALRALNAHLHTNTR